MNGALVYGGNGGGNGAIFDAVTATSGAVTYIGASGGSNVTLGGAASHIVGLVKGSITAANATGSNTFFLSSGDISVADGSGPTAIVTGTGNETLSPGAGTTLLIVQAQLSTRRQFTIANFNGSHDFINLSAFPAGAQAAAFASEKISGANNVTVTLTDGTTILFNNPQNLNSFSFT
jgi:hypothetical protein